MPTVCWRRLPCRCEPCRDLQGGADPDENHCVLTLEAGTWCETRVDFKSALDAAATNAKKVAAKAQRAAKKASQIALLVAQAAPILADPERAPSPQAAVAAADRADAAAVTPAFVAAYGGEDARAVAVARGETAFLYARAAESSGEEDEDEEAGRGAGAGARARGGV